MKPFVTVPPAQAEALFDTQNCCDAQDTRREDYLADLRRWDQTASQPWRDDDGDDSVPGGSFTSRPPRPAPSFGRVP